MKRYYKLLSILLFLTLSTITFSNQNRVLLISSYNSNFPTFYQQIKGLRSVLKEDKYIIDIEYMDSKRFNTKQAKKIFFDNLVYKLKKLPKYDIILSSDDNALNFVLDNYDILFKDQKIVFFGVNNIKKAFSMNENENITGIIEAVSMRDTIDVALNMMPNAKNIYAISDSSQTVKSDLNLFYTYKSDFLGYNFKEIDLKKLSFDEFKNTLSNIDKNDIVILLSAYNDKTGEIINFNTVINVISKYSTVPVFHLWEPGIKNGLIGGKVISQFEQAKDAGIFVKRILEDKEEGKIYVKIESPNKYIFNYDVIKKFKINKNNIPKESILLKINPNKRIIKCDLLRVFLILIVIFLIIIVILVFNNIKIKSIKYDLELSNSNFYSLFENSPISLWYEDLSNVKKILAKLKDKNILDIRDYLKKNPLIVNECAKAIIICDINNETLRLYKVKSKVDLLNDISESFTENSYVILIEEIIAIWENKTYFQMEGEVKDFKGNLINIIIQWNVLNKDHNNYDKIILSMIDISDRKIIEKENLKQKDAAEYANKSKTQFLANISHELRTPLNGIIGMLELLKNTELNLEQIEYMKTLDYSSKNLLSLINNILDISKLEKGKYELENKLFNINNLIRYLKDSFAVITDKKKIDLIFDIKENIPDIFYGDEGKIRQVLINLIGNAIKFTDKGYVKLCMEKLIVIKNRMEIKFSVIDTGLGISKSKFEEIFEPFMQTKKNSVKKYEGTGLGLYITKNLIETMNGKIWLESEENVGTKFYFTIMIKEIDDNIGIEKSLMKKNIKINKEFSQNFVKEKPQQIEDIKLSKDDEFNNNLGKDTSEILVMLVEDNKINMLTTKTILEKKGYKVLACYDGQEAIEKYEDFDVDIILMDIQMPIINGFEVTKYIRTNSNKEVPIIALTAYAMEEDRKKCLEFGMNDFISKPFNSKELFSKIEKLLKK